MASIKEAILRNCLFYTDDAGCKCTIETGCFGDIVVRFPNGVCKKVARASNGVDLLVPTPDGKTVKVCL